jgi:hypothetical protein
MIDQDFYALISAPGGSAQIGEFDRAMGIYWTSSRKAALVDAIAAGKISLKDAQSRFRLSDEELSSWVAALEKNGPPGLRATRFQVYRDNPRLARPAPREKAIAPTQVCIDR